MSVPNVITMSDVKKHKKKESVWMVINNEVYDVTKFLNEHPGGAETLIDHGGKDATDAFEDVGHSADAREMMKKYKIGTLPSQERKTFVETCNKWKWILLALGVAVIAGVAYKKYSSG